MIVLMTSLTSRRARSHPAMPPQTAPPSAPAARMIAIAIACGKSPRCGPIAPAAIAPIVSCPSAPIFHSAPENAIETASPVKISGVDFTIVSTHAYQLPNAPSPSAANTPIGDAPSASEHDRDQRGRQRQRRERFRNRGQHQSRAPAISRPSRSGSRSSGLVSRIFPRLIISSRPQIASNSSRSLEISSTAPPLAAKSRIVR